MPNIDNCKTSDPIAVHLWRNLDKREQRNYHPSLSQLIRFCCNEVFLEITLTSLKSMLLTTMALYPCLNWLQFLLPELPLFAFTTLSYPYINY